MKGRRCDTCKEEKAITDFYRNKSKHDGIASTCKFCATRMLDKHRRTSKYKRNMLDRQRRYREEFPEKAKANRLARYAKIVGWLQQPESCEDCKKLLPKLEMAHIDYNEPLKIRWLCTKCHRNFDKNREQMYESKNIQTNMGDHHTG
jgi:hypothetical protein